MAWATDESKIRFPAGARDFSLLHSIQTGSEVHTASCPIGTGGSSAGHKKAGKWTDHSPPSSDEIKKSGSVPPLPHTSSWRGSQLIKLHVPAVSALRLDPLYQLCSSRLGGPQSRSRRSGEEKKNLLSLPGIEIQTTLFILIINISTQVSLNFYLRRFRFTVLILQNQIP
jgi:hypothetical protein